MDLTGVKAVGTGGASGLGNATARFLATSGAQVVLLDRDTARGPEQAAEIGAGFQECDVTDEGSVQAALSGAADHMGKHYEAHDDGNDQDGDVHVISTAYGR